MGDIRLWDRMRTKGMAMFETVVYWYGCECLYMDVAALCLGGQYKISRLVSMHETVSRR